MKETGSVLFTLLAVYLLDDPSSLPYMYGSFFGNRISGKLTSTRRARAKFFLIGKTVLPNFPESGILAYMYRSQFFANQGKVLLIYGVF